MEDTNAHLRLVQGSEESGILCCEGGDTIARTSRHRECLPISLPDNDHVFSKVTCYLPPRKKREIKR